ncbi:MAG: hypothetical protein JNM99_14720 [Verrucomicrobiaceae bacterium]|nr:hypothetical protein [Verrucomicrobiaceae bacterium]
MKTPLVMLGLVLLGCATSSRRPNVERYTSVITISSSAPLHSKDPRIAYANLLTSRPRGSALKSVPVASFPIGWSELTNWQFPVFEGRHPRGHYYQSQLIQTESGKVRFVIATDMEVDARTLTDMTTHGEVHKVATSVRLIDAVAYYYPASERTTPSTNN